MSIDPEALLSAAASAATHAYSPYSKFCVGAAVETASGRVFTGCNVENASYGLTICAERVAIFNAISQGDSKVVAVAVSSGGAASPCGACRQVLSEFGPEMQVILGDRDGRFSEQLSLKELLPKAFGPDFKKE
ncbi:cytidine deaminase [Opitutia bacterium ISCC 51]|nr:cytidine deaminase [Opitutae bacterium ISCC 51]QXD28540.1 cytidine deaminase [Opitutae bacterium ISCC 52]